jgi:dihydrofolate reductase
MILPDRRNIVLTNSGIVDLKNLEVAHSFKEVDSMIQDDDEVFYIGGGEIYRQALAEVERIYATEVDASIYPADTFFPDIKQNWRVIDSKEYNSDERNIYPYSFKTYEPYNHK